MNRRTLLTASIAVISSTVTGCLENRGLMGDSDDSGEDADPTDTDTTEPEDGDGSDGGTATDSRCPDDRETDEQPTICATHFEILNEWGDKEESASVTFDEEAVTATGIIMGRNGCYTARLAETVLEDGQLTVNIESYEDAEEDEGCTGALIFIEYEATIEIHGPRPASVRVEHNGEHVTTEQLS